MIPFLQSIYHKQFEAQVSHKNFGTLNTSETNIINQNTIWIGEILNCLQFYARFLVKNLLRQYIKAKT